MNNEKKNHCTASGQCQGANDACGYYRHGALTGSCIFATPLTDRCLSPWALSAARSEPKNYCSPSGICTAGEGRDRSPIDPPSGAFGERAQHSESACAYYIQGAADGICRHRAWCDVCCSVAAVTAAKAARSGIAPNNAGIAPRAIRQEARA